MKNHKPVFVVSVVSLLWILFAVGCLYAQGGLWYKKNWTAYANYVSSKFGISDSVPDNFVDMNQYYVIRLVRKNHNVGNMYGPVF